MKSRKVRVVLKYERESLDKAPMDGGTVCVVVKNSTFFYWKGPDFRAPGAPWALTTSEIPVKKKVEVKNRVILKKNI